MGQEDINIKVYIIKSANKILGPYTVKEVVDQIWTRKINAFDEVKSPFTRWSFVRDDQALGKVFQDLVEAKATSEDTSDITTTIELTALTVSNKLSKIRESSYITASIVSNEHLEFEDYQEAAEDIEAKGSSVKVVSVSPQYKKKTSNITRYLYVAILLVSILLFGSLLLEETQVVKTLSENHTKWDTIHYLGDSDVIMALYDKTKNYPIESNYRFIEAFIDKDELLEADAIVQRLSSEVLPAKDKAKLLNYQGVIELHRQNFQEGIGSFKEALTLDPLLEEAQLNLVDGLLLVDEIQEAKAYLLEEVKLENAQSTKVYLELETIFFDGAFQPEDDSWVGSLASQASQPFDQKQEILILAGLLFLEKNHVNESMQMFQQALDVLPDYFFKNIQTQALYHPKVAVQKTLVFLKRYEFKYQGNPYFLAAMAMLYHKIQSPILAKKYYEQAVKINPLDPFLKAMGLLFHPDFNENDYTEKILSGQLTLLEAKLASRYCFNNDRLKCADDLWNYILMVEPGSIEATSGKIRLYLSRGMFDEAKQWLYKGLGLAPRYIPLRKIELESKL